jgi:hypothetical protein
MHGGEKHTRPLARAFTGTLLKVSDAAQTGVISRFEYSDAAVH